MAFEPGLSRRRDVRRVTGHGVGLWAGGIMLMVFVSPGCATAPPEPQLRELAGQVIYNGLAYEPNPAIRAQATEAAGDVLSHEARMILRQQLRDEHPGVRFAACMALGELQDRSVMGELRRLAEDPEPSVRVGAYYALERLGETTHRNAWARALLRHEDVVVRRNAALAFRQLGDKEVIPLLQRAALEDEDDGVRRQALEALAFLGERDAVNRFIHDSYGGAGFLQTFALLTLGHVPDAKVIPVLRRGLESSDYIEAQLAAARGLAMHGDLQGYALARRSLTWNSPKHGLSDDPPELQRMRVHSMAAMALGEMGDPDALSPLYGVMKDNENPHVQLAAATAILKILGGEDVNAMPEPDRTASIR